MSVAGMQADERMYQNQAHYRDYGHEDAGTLTQRHGIDLDERLGSFQGEESVQIWGAEQEEDRSKESHDSGGQCTGQDTSTGNNATIKCQQKVRNGRNKIHAYLALRVSSATWPEASKPIIVPVVNRLRGVSNKV